MKNLRSLSIISLALVLSLTLCQVASTTNKQQQPAQPLVSKIIPQPKARSARSLSDMFEKVKSKIFGSRKQATSNSVASGSNQAQSVASAINPAQRQPLGDLNSYNQQFNPLYAGAYNNYQNWPSNNQYLGQQYNPNNGFSQSAGSSMYPSLTGTQGSGSLAGIEGLQGSQASINPAANTNSASNGAGLLASASHLFTQYLSPSSSSSSSSSNQASNVQTSAQSQLQPNGQQNMLSPQQQSQYNEFASILDTMVAQTGISPQRQPNLNQYLNGVSSQQAGQQQQVGAQGAYGQSISSGNNNNNNMMGVSGSMVGDNEMSGSSNVQSYAPVGASQQQASQKSSMVGLAEQLAPGANFNKLVSFPFSLSSNEDPSKEGRFKLHIPYLNQHVKRSDQANSVAPQQRNQQQQQQYLNSYYNLQQQYLNNQAQQPSMAAQASQVVPTIVSPQSSQVAPNSPVASQSSSVASSSSSSSSSSSPVSAAAASPVAQQSASSSVSNPSVSSSITSQQNSRPSWSVADLQSGTSASKLIPMPQGGPSSVDLASSSQS